MFLVLSSFLDSVWLSIYGSYIHDIPVYTSAVNVGEVRRVVGTAVVRFVHPQERVNNLLKFVFVSSAVLLVIKVLAVCPTAS